MRRVSTQARKLRTSIALKYLSKLIVHKFWRNTYIIRINSARRSTSSLLFCDISLKVRVERFRVSTLRETAKEETATDAFPSIFFVFRRFTQVRNPSNMGIVSTHISRSWLKFEGILNERCWFRICNKILRNIFLRDPVEPFYPRVPHWTEFSGPFSNANWWY